MTVNTVIAKEPLQVALAPAVTVGTYASGNCIGALTEVADASLSDAWVLLQSAVILDAAKQNQPVDILLFSSQPAGTFADKVTPTISAADQKKILGVVHVTDWSAEGIGQAQNLAMPVHVANPNGLWAVMIARGAPTFAAVDNITLKLKFIPAR